MRRARPSSPPSGIARGVALARTQPSSASFSGLPGVVLSSQTAAQGVSASNLYYMPFCVDAPLTITGVKSQLSNTTTVGAKVRFSIYRADNAWQPLDLVSGGDLGEMAISGGSGIKTISGLSVRLSAGNYLLRMHSDASGTQGSFNTLRGSPIAGQPFDYVTNWQLIIQMGKTAVAYAAAESPGTAWDKLSTATSPFMYLALLLWTPNAP
jgi:hypothetical protein